jgi:hypothetical protein
MNIGSLKFHFSLTPSDLHTIREAIRQWGMPQTYIDGFTDAVLYRHFERWEQFVNIDWSEWDWSEYSHDIGCRFWIQVAIEHSSLDTRIVLEQQVAPLDAIFQSRMRPLKRPNVLGCISLSHHPYFWESHTLHPEDHLNKIEKEHKGY